MLDMILPKNENKADRALRVLIGMGVVSLAFVGPRTPWAYAGLILVVTGLLGSCPIYALLGLSTCKDGAC